MFPQLQNKTKRRMVENYCENAMREQIPTCSAALSPELQALILQLSTYSNIWRSKHILRLDIHGLNFWCASGTLALPHCTWWQLYPSRSSGQKPHNHSCLHSFSLSLHLGCQKVHLVLLSKCNLNMTISHHLFYYNLSVSHHIFCRCLTGLTAYSLALQQSIVYRAARVIFSRY